MQLFFQNKQLEEYENGQLVTVCDASIVANVNNHPKDNKNGYPGFSNEIFEYNIEVDENKCFVFPRKGFYKESGWYLICKNKRTGELYRDIMRTTQLPPERKKESVSNQELGAILTMLTKNIDRAII